MTVTASKLREDVYNILDHVIETGEPVEIVRKGKIVRLVAEAPPSRISRLKKRNCILGDPEDLVSIDWSKEWKPSL